VHRRFSGTPEKETPNPFGLGVSGGTRLELRRDLHLADRVQGEPWIAVAMRERLQGAANCAQVDTLRELTSGFLRLVVCNCHTRQDQRGGCGEF
jgi:hypothetical protein